MIVLKRPKINEKEAHFKKKKIDQKSKRNEL